MYAYGNCITCSVCYIIRDLLLLLKCLFTGVDFTKKGKAYVKTAADVAFPFFPLVFMFNETHQRETQEIQRRSGLKRMFGFGFYMKLNVAVCFTCIVTKDENNLKKETHIVLRSLKVVKMNE